MNSTLIVSCQPVPDSPLDKPEIVAAMALAAEQAGAVAIRIEGVANLQATRAVVPLRRGLNVTMLHLLLLREIGPTDSCGWGRRNNPSKISAKIPQLCPQFVCFSLRKSVQNLPKLRSMVHFSRVSEFMKQNIIHEVWWKQHQITGQIDASNCRTTPPTALASRDFHPFVLKIVTIGQFFQQRWKIVLRPFLQRTDDGVTQ